MNAHRFMAGCIGIGAVLLLSLAALAAWQHTQITRTRDSQRLTQARAAQRLIETWRREDLQRRAELVADDPAFAGYVEMAIGGALPGMPVDTTSLVDLLREREVRLELSASALLDRNGRVVVATSNAIGTGRLEGDAVFEQARRSAATASGVRARDGVPMHVAIVPLAAVGVSEGYLLAGVPLGRRFATDIASVTGGDAVLLRTGSARALATTLAPAVLAEFERQVPAGGFDPGARVSVDIGGIERAVFVQPLFGSRQATLAVLAPSRASWAAIWAPWLLTGALLVTGLLLAGRWVWRNVLSPVEAIAERLDRASAGDHRLRIAEEHAGSMIRLASAFNRLMASLRA